MRLSTKYSNVLCVLSEKMSNFVSRKILNLNYMAKKNVAGNGKPIVIAFRNNLYRVVTRRLNKHVKRNIERFTSYFMFKPAREVFNCLTSSFAISNTAGSHENKNLKSLFAVSTIIQLAI